jgi:hypothetical protein
LASASISAARTPDRSGRRRRAWTITSARAAAIRCAAPLTRTSARAASVGQGCSPAGAELGFGGVGRSVVDVNDLEPAAGQRRRDLGDQRGDVPASFRTGTITDTAGPFVLAWFVLAWLMLSVAG